MASALNPDTNKLSSGIAGFRRKPSSLLQPAKDKLLDTKDAAKLTEIEKRLAVLDAKADPAPAPVPAPVPAPGPTTDEVKSLIDDKVAAAVAPLELKVSENAAATADRDSKISEEVAGLRKYVDALAARVDGLESSRDEIRTLIDRLSGGQQYPGPESNPGSKKK